MTFAEQLRAQTKFAQGSGMTCCAEHIDHLAKMAMSASKAGKSSISVTNRDLSWLAYTDADTIPALAEYVRKYWIVAASTGGNGDGVEYLRIEW